MFTRYTVLFIGYSHNDVIMKYLARGLGRVKDRFILTPDPSDRLWIQIGIKPIEFKKGSDGSHDALWHALDGWAFDAGMRLLDHQERVKHLVSLQVPPLNPEDNSYLESIVADEGTVKIFTDHARDPAWLWWAAERPVFRRLFDQRPGRTDVAAQRLALWFAEHYVTEEQSGVALAVVLNAGGRLGPDLAYAVSRRLNNLPKPCPAALRPWLLLAVRDARNQPSEFFDFLLSSTLWTQDPDTALYLFTHLTEPQPYLMPGLFNTTRLEVGVRGNDFWLRKAWTDVFRPVCPTPLGSYCQSSTNTYDEHTLNSRLPKGQRRPPGQVTAEQLSSRTLQINSPVRLGFSLTPRGTVLNPCLTRLAPRQLRNSIPGLRATCRCFGASRFTDGSNGSTSARPRNLHGCEASHGYSIPV